MDRTLFQMKLTATTKQLASAEREIDLLGSAAPAAVLDSVRKAARGLVELGELFNGAAESAPATRTCPTCGKTIMAAATLCGYCWTKTDALSS